MKHILKSKLSHLSQDAHWTLEGDDFYIVGCPTSGDPTAAIILGFYKDSLLSFMGFWEWTDFLDETELSDEFLTKLFNMIEHRLKEGDRGFYCVTLYSIVGRVLLLYPERVNKAMRLMRGTTL